MTRPGLAWFVLIMFDFEGRYRKQTNGMYFGINREEDYIAIPARRDAVAVLRDALDRCSDRDMRTAEVRAALDYLRRSASKKWAHDRFWEALGWPEPIGRWQNVNASLNGILREIPKRQGDSY